jgi:trigger factor
MKAVVEPLEGNKVKLSVEVDEQEFEQAIEAAFKKISREVRIPGFRPGKAPRRVLEARLGKETGRAEALRDALPDYYARAVRDHDVDAIAAPEIDITGGEEEGPVAFDAVVEIRPQLHLVGYDGLRVEVPSPVVSEDDISEQIDRLRGSFGELVATDKPAEDGFHLTIDLVATQDGEPVSALTTSDFLYELGSGSVLPELDEKLQGAKAGDALIFEAAFGDDTVKLEVAVTDVKEKVLPEVTDEWAGEASEFDTVDELRADIVKRSTLMKKVQATMAMRNGAVEALVELVDTDVPQALIDGEVERRAHDLGHRLEAQGATIQQYLSATGQSEEDLIAQLRAEALPAVKADLALRAIADAEQIVVTEDDLEEEMARLAATYQVTPEVLRTQLERVEQIPAVRSDLRKSKALEWLIEHVELVDADGLAVDRELLILVPETEADPGSATDSGSATQADETSTDEVDTSEHDASEHDTTDQLVEPTPTAES